VIEDMTLTGVITGGRPRCLHCNYEHGNPMNLGDPPPISLAGTARRRDLSFLHLGQLQDARSG
jgi:hypothetical protein